MEEIKTHYSLIRTASLKVYALMNSTQSKTFCPVGNSLLTVLKLIADWKRPEAAFSLGAGVINSNITT